jgi:hypothetical protein
MGHYSSNRYILYLYTPRNLAGALSHCPTVPFSILALFKAISNGTHVLKMGHMYCPIAIDFIFFVWHNPVSTLSEVPPPLRSDILREV